MVVDWYKTRTTVRDGSNIIQIREYFW